MTDQDKIFFGEQGLTNASASHICTVCAERAQAVQSKLNGITLLDETLEIVATGTKTDVRSGWSKQDTDEIPAMIQEIGDYYALNAWLKEAIKARQKAQNEICDTSYDKWKEQQGIDEEDERMFKTELVRPSNPQDVTGEEILAGWSVKDRNRVYELQSRAAIIGKYIGKDGAYTKARNAYMERRNNPVDVKGDGQDTTIYRYTASIDDFNEEALLTQLEAQHRALNAELNGLLHRVELEGRAKALERDTQYKHDLAEYNEAYAKELGEYNAKHAEWQARHKDLTIQHADWKKAELEALQAMRIVIPNDLRETYNKVK